MSRLGVYDFPEEPSTVYLDQLTIGADSGGDVFANDGRTGFYVLNLSTAPITVTLEHATDCDQRFAHDAPVSVPYPFAGFIASRLRPERFSDAHGDVSVTYSSATLVYVLPVRLG